MLKKATIDDLTLALKFLPKGEKNRFVDMDRTITKLFEEDPDNHGFFDKIEVKRISYSFDLDELNEKKAELHQLSIDAYKEKLLTDLNSENYEPLLNEEQQENSELYIQSGNTWIKERYQKLKKQMEQIYQNFREKKVEHMTGIAYVTFASSRQANHLLKIYGRNDRWSKLYGFFDCRKNKLVLKLDGKEHRIRVKRAPEPSDILWENLKYSNLQKLLRSSLGFLVSFLLVFLAFFWVYYVRIGRVSFE